ncbi:MAG: hypothetical protein ABEJ56_05015 [Candidatus Nanohaloarchaea archaeon]
MNLPLISQVPEQFATVILLVLLVLVFVVAFKIMKMVFETITVSVLSAGFYAALSQVFSYQFSFNQMLTYAFLGATLYMVYAFLASAFYLLEKIISVPFSAVKMLMMPLKAAYSRLKEEIKLREFRWRRNGSEDEESTKQVIVDRLDDGE